MIDVELVIKIPEEVYKALKMNSTLSFLNMDQRSIAVNYLIHGILTGKPLPVELYEAEGYPEWLPLEQEPKTEIIDKIKKIVTEWEEDSWTDNLSYKCMIKISELVGEWD